MTEPSAMPTGRQLDIEVATKIMGLKVMALDWPCGYDPDSGLYSAAMQRESPSGWFDEVGPVFEISEDWALPVPHYSSDIEAAQDVVAAIKAKGEPTISRFLHALDESYQEYLRAVDMSSWHGRLRWFLFEANQTEVICCAALKAVEE